MLLCPFSRGNHIYACEDSDKPSCKALMTVKSEEKFMPKLSCRKGKHPVRPLFSPSWITEKTLYLINPSSLRLHCAALDKMEARETKCRLAAAAAAARTAQHGSDTEPAKCNGRPNHTSCITKNKQHCVAVFPLHWSHVTPVALPYCTSKICHESDDQCSSNCPPLV